MYYREIETIRNVMKEEYPAHYQQLVNNNRLEQNLQGMQDQMNQEVDQAIAAIQPRLKGMEMQEVEQEMHAAARQAKEISQHSLLATLQAKYQETTE